MAIFLGVFWIVFGLLYIAWKAHKEYPGSVLVTVGCVGGVISIFLIIRFLIEGSYRISLLFGIIFSSILILALFVLACFAFAHVWKMHEPDRVRKEIENKYRDYRPSEYEIELAIKHPIFSKEYRISEIQQAFLLDPNSELYWKNDPIIKNHAIWFYRALLIQRKTQEEVERRRKQ